MSYLKYNSDLFIGVPELNRLSSFLDTNGFRKNLLQTSESFGLIQNKYSDPSFSNGRVERDSDTEVGQKTIKIRELAGIDSAGNVLYSPEQRSILLPDDGSWYWIKLSYAISNIEAGTFTLSANGDLVDTSGNAELTKIFRGMPDFPTRIKFSNSQYNTLEYDVLSVIDDQNAILQHPASNLGDTAFEPETGLKIKIVGTFTRGIAVPDDRKFIFNYDYATAILVPEVFSNTQPTHTQDIDFFLARVKSDGSTVVIQDKRTQFWEPKGSYFNKLIDRNSNPCIGIESTQFNNEFSPSDRNIVHVGWGIRSTNWTVDTSNNIVTFNSAIGGKFKSVTDFTNGNADGWRMYYPNGKYDRVLTSIKQGSAINFSLDKLDVNNLSSDGGTTFNAGTIVVVPDCEEVEILFTPNPSDNKSAITESFNFPVNEAFGRCDVLVYADSTCLYNVKYRYKTFKEYTAYTVIPSDTVHGYLTEASFDDNGNLKSSPDQVFHTYTTNPTNGFIQLTLSPNSFSHFKTNVYSGDILGVNTITTIPNVNQTLTVGVDKKYQKFTGTLSISDDVTYALSRVGAQPGSEFIIHFDATTFNISTHSVIIADDSGSGLIALKHILQADIYSMMNIDGGISFKCTYDGINNKWLIFQNYEIGISNEVRMLDVDSTFLSTNFDASTHMGKTKKHFGWILLVDMPGTMPVGHGTLTESGIGSTPFNLGTTGGKSKHQLVEDEMPKHKFEIDVTQAPSTEWDQSGSGSGCPIVRVGGAGNPDGSYISAPTDPGYTEERGNDEYHNNMSPYKVFAFIKRTY